MTVWKIMVHFVNYGAIDIAYEISPTENRVVWRHLEIEYFDGIPVIYEGEYEEPIVVSEEERPEDIEDMVNIVIEKGIKDGTLYDTWVVLAEQY